MKSFSSFRSGRRLGYSLVELLGALTVVSVVGGILVNSLYVGMDRKSWGGEKEALENISDALTEYISTSQTIPSSESWANSVADVMGEALVEIESNDFSNRRRLLVDPNFWGVGDDALPFIQSAEGCPLPNSPRLMLVSSVGRALPDDGISFSDVWSTGDGEAISEDAPWDTWRGDWSDIVIERVDLSGLFHHVILDNSLNDADAGYRVNEIGGVAGLPKLVTGEALDTYFISESALELCAGQDSVALSLIREDQSYYFVRGSWRKTVAESEGEGTLVAAVVGEALRSWVEDNTVDYVDLWIDRRQDRFDLVRAQIDCAISAGETLISVEFSADDLSADVTSSENIGLVELNYEDGSKETVVPASTNNATVWGTGDNEGKLIAGTWVESGSDSGVDGDFFVNPGVSSGGGAAVVSGHFSEDGQTVTATSTKDLSNVVLNLANGEHQKFEGIEGYHLSFSATGSNAGQIILGVWIKSGSNSSGDGPGYGEYVANPYL